MFLLISGLAKPTAILSYTKVVKVCSYIFLPPVCNRIKRSLAKPLAQCRTANNFLFIINRIFLLHFAMLLVFLYLN